MVEDTAHRCESQLLSGVSVAPTLGRSSVNGVKRVSKESARTSMRLEVETHVQEIVTTNDRLERLLSVLFLRLLLGFSRFVSILRGHDRK